MKNFSPSGFRTISRLLWLGLALARIAPAAGPYEHWNETRRAYFEEYRAVTFGGGQFVAVGDHATLVTSPDGRNWTRQSIPVTGELQGVAYGVTHGVGKYVVVGSIVVGGQGRLLHSTDGRNWSLASTVLLPNTMRAVAFGGGRFVAVGNSGKIHSSDDGTNWTERADVAGILDGVAYGNGLFVAVNLDGDAFASSDGGLTWRTGDFSPVLNITSRPVAYGDGRFLLADFDGHSLITTNGTSILGTGRFTGAAYAATYAQGNFIVAGVDSSLSYLAWSANGLSWSERWLTDWPYRLRGIAYGNGLLVVVGDDTQNLNTGLILTHDTMPKIPEVIRWPANFVVTNGASVDLSFETWRTSAESYQWFLNGQPLANATSRSLRVTDVQAEDTGRYTVRVVNALGSITTTAGGLLTTYEPQRQVGITLSNAVGSSVRIDYRASLRPADGWRALTNLTLPRSPYLFMEPAGTTNPPQRYFRTAATAGTPTRLAIARYNGFRFQGLSGSTCAVEYRDAATSPWAALMTLTLTNSPLVWFDESSGNRPRRQYRITANP